MIPFLSLFTVQIVILFLRNMLYDRKLTCGDKNTFFFFLKKAFSTWRDIYALQMLTIVFDDDDVI